MKGYIKNKTAGWRHAMKRSIGPNQTVTLDELYEQYGEKHDLEEGLPFVEWLRSVKLPDRSMWEVVYGEGEEAAEQAEEPVEEEKTESDPGTVRPFVKKELTVEKVVNMTVRTARVELKKITDINLLKYAYEHARQLANKDTLCRALLKRIKELELTRR